MCQRRPAGLCCELPVTRPWVNACALGLAVGCAGHPAERGQLMLALGTDLSVPKDLDEIRVEVGPDSETAVATQRDFPLLPGEPPPFGKPLPGTLAIVPSNSGGENVSVRVFGQHRDPNTGETATRIVREAVVTIPSDRVATLSMPLDWLCDGKVERSGDGYRSSCRTGETCVAGSCQRALLANSELPDYHPAAVFGGGSETGEDGYCLDVAACFADAKVSVPDADCAVPLPSRAQPYQLNVALVLAADVPDGHCLERRCYIPLVSDEEEGFSLHGSTILLPTAACADARVVGVAVSSACRTREPSIPVCGPWTGWKH